MSFFDAEPEKSKRVPLIARCGACGLLKRCTTPKMPVFGNGERGIMVVSESPSLAEDLAGLPVYGDRGTVLKSLMSLQSIDLERDCWKTDALICSSLDRQPTNNEVDYCRPNVLSAIDRLRPKVIILMGAAAVRSVIGPAWRGDVGQMETWAGWCIPSRRYNAWLCPTYSISHLLSLDRRDLGAVTFLYQKQHTGRAVAVSRSYPWSDVPIDRVEIEMDVGKAAMWLAEIQKTGGVISFDYETNCLKPEKQGSAIYSCAVCWNGDRTISFPWAGAAVSAMRDLLSSSVKKIGANTKFEDRWTRNKLGVEVKNWIWDCMLSAHHLDNRRGVCSVKFQAFVRLGVDEWGSELSRYFEMEDDKGLNGIGQIDLRSLLEYNGLDALYEYQVAELQRKEMTGSK